MHSNTKRQHITWGLEKWVLRHSLKYKRIIGEMMPIKVKGGGNGVLQATSQTRTQIQHL